MTKTQTEKKTVKTQQKKCQREAKWTTAKETGGMMGDNGERELYKHEGGEEKKKAAEWYQKQWKTEKKKTKTCWKKDGEAIKSGVNKS